MTRVSRRAFLAGLAVVLLPAALKPRRRGFGLAPFGVTPFGR